jgi:hypothetical protein
MDDISSENVTRKLIRLSEPLSIIVIGQTNARQLARSLRAKIKQAQAVLQLEKNRLTTYGGQRFIVDKICLVEGLVQLIPTIEVAGEPSLLTMSILVLAGMLDPEYNVLLTSQDVCEELRRLPR